MNNRKRPLTRKFALAGLYAAMSTVAFTIESLFPPLFVPGARMGISNVFILLAGLTLGDIYGAAVLVIKICLGSLFAGNPSAIVYSLPAGALSYAAQMSALRIGKFSVVAASVFGATLNTCVQGLIFCLTTGTAAFVVYLPYLAIIGAVAGTVVGFAVYLIIKKLPQSLLCDNDSKQEEQI